MRVIWVSRDEEKLLVRDDREAWLIADCVNFESALGVGRVSVLEECDEPRWFPLAQS
jgi:hypothetical protein